MGRKRASRADARPGIRHLERARTALQVARSLWSDPLCNPALASALLGTFEASCALLLFSGHPAPAGMGTEERVRVARWVLEQYVRSGTLSSSFEPLLELLAATPGDEVSEEALTDGYEAAFQFVGAVTLIVQPEVVGRVVRATGDRVKVRASHEPALLNSASEAFTLLVENLHPDVPLDVCAGAFLHLAGGYAIQALSGPIRDGIFVSMLAAGSSQRDRLGPLILEFIQHKSESCRRQEKKGATPDWPAAPRGVYEIPPGRRMLELAFQSATSVLGLVIDNNPRIEPHEIARAALTVVSYDIDENFGPEKRDRLFTWILVEGSDDDSRLPPLVNQLLKAIPLIQTSFGSC